MVACGPLHKVVLLLLGGMVAVLTMMNFTSVPAYFLAHRAESFQCTSTKIASFSQERVIFHRYQDVAGPLHFPSSHYEWTTQKKKHVLLFFESVRCSTPGSSVIDVGMNDATYTVLAAKRGCRIVAFELQKQCISLACMILQINQLSLNVSIFRKLVSDRSGREYFMNVDEDCTIGSGTLGPEYIPTRPTSIIHERLFSTTLDDELRTEQRIEFMKVTLNDTSMLWFRGAQSLFKRNIIRKAVVQCFHLSEKSFTETVSNLSDLYDWGYSIECLDAPRTYKTKREWMTLQNRTSCDCIDLGITLVIKTPAPAPLPVESRTSVNGERIRRIAFLIRTNKDTPFIRAQTAKIANELRMCEGCNITVFYLFHADGQSTESLRDFVRSVGVEFAPFFEGNMTSVTGPKALSLAGGGIFQLYFHEPSIVFWWKSVRMKYDFVWVQEDDAFFNGNMCSFVSHRELESPDLVTPRCDSRAFRNPSFDYQVSFSTWKVPLERFRKMNENIVGYSARLLGVLQGFLELDLLLYGEYFPCTICSSLPWCKAQNLYDLQLISENFDCCRHPLSGEEFLRITSSQDRRWYHRFKWENIPREGKPGILVLQSDDPKVFRQFSILNNETATRNQFQYLKRDGRSSFPPRWEKVPPHWQKVFEVQQIMRKKHFDYVFWLDSNALIVNPGRILHLLDERKNCSMWISPDSLISRYSGAFIVRNDGNGVHLINTWASLYNSSKWAFSNNIWTTNGTKADEEYELGALAKKMWQHPLVCKCPYYVLNEMSCDKLRNETIIVHLTEPISSAKRCMQIANGNR